MNTQQLQLVTFEQAKRLKQLRFDLECETFYQDGNIDNCHNIINYNTNEGFDEERDEYYSFFDEDDGICSAPTVALALKWMRDVKGIFSCVYFDLTSLRKGYFGSLFKFDEKTSIKRTETISIYEAAESALLDELLTILEKEV